jgi:hypothetical protein
MRAAAIIAAGLLMMGLGITAASASPTKATLAQECVPVDAVEYQPAVYATVHHDAIQETFTTVHHEAVTHTEWKYEKHGGFGKVYVDNNTFKYVDENGVGYDDKRDIPRDTGYYERTGHTRSVTDVEAYDEQVGNGDGVPAWDEQVLVTPEILAVEGVPCPDQIASSPSHIVTEWYTWDTGAWTPNATGASTTHWPQTLVGAGQIAPTTCETTYQQDKYVGTRAAIDAVLADGILTNNGLPEDFLIVKDWKFVSTGECQEEPIAVSMNLTYMAACAPDPTNTWRIRNSSDRPVDYTLEYYGQGVVASGTAPIGDSFVDLPRTTATAILKWGGGDSGIVAGSKTKASGVDQVCSVEVTAVEASVVDPPECGPNNDVLDIPTTEGVTYSDTGWINNQRTITATANEGYTLVGTSTWTFTDDATPCPVELTEVSVSASVVDPPVCGPNNNVLNAFSTEGVTYSDTGWINNQRTITATANEGFTLVGTSTWTFTDVPIEGCPDEGPVFSFTPTRTLAYAGELAYTGAPSSTGGLVALAIFLLASGTVLVVTKTRD